MIDTKKAMADIAAVEGDLVAVPKAQWREILDQVALGNQARRDLAAIRRKAA